jgi:hypothetical protein
VACEDNDIPEHQKYCENQALLLLKDTMFISETDTAISKLSDIVFSKLYKSDIPIDSFWIYKEVNHLQNLLDKYNREVAVLDIDGVYDENCNCIRDYLYIVSNLEKYTAQLNELKKKYTKKNYAMRCEYMQTYITSYASKYKLTYLFIFNQNYRYMYGMLIGSEDIE